MISTVFFDVIETLFFFIYPGVPIFFGALKWQFFQPLADRVKSKLTSWKGKCLRMMRGL